MNMMYIKGLVYIAVILLDKVLQLIASIFIDNDESVISLLLNASKCIYGCNEINIICQCLVD